MKHAGEARRAALKLIFLALLITGAPAAAVWLSGFHIKPLVGALAGLWFLFTAFTLYFFRDPNPETPTGPGLVVAPGHGTVDFIDQLPDSDFMGGPCHRVSIFLSVIDVHVQNAPVRGKITCVAHTSGKYLNAMREDCAVHNENVLVGFESTETIGEKIGVRLIAGLIARRIVPFVKVGDELARGERMSLIQFGSRCDVYLPLRYQVKTKLGEKVVGGETVLASR